MGDVPGAAQQGRAGGGVRVLRVRDSGARGCSSPPRCVSSAPSPAWGAFGLRVGHGQSQFCRVGPVHRQEEVELGAGDRGCCPVRSRAACSVVSGRWALGPGRPPCRGLLSPRLCSVPGREWGGAASFPLDPGNQVLASLGHPATSQPLASQPCRQVAGVPIRPHWTWVPAWKGHQPVPGR